MIICNLDININNNFYVDVGISKYSNQNKKKWEINSITILLSTLKIIIYYYIISRMPVFLKYYFVIIYELKK